MNGTNFIINRMIIQEYRNEGLDNVRDYINK